MGWGTPDTWGVPDVWSDSAPQPDTVATSTAAPTPLILYRNLGPNNDPLWGQGRSNFLADRDAVAQAVLTRLRLFQGEWWADLTDGTPYFQSILGTGGSQQNIQAITFLLVQRIKGTPFVTTVSDVASNFNKATRGMQFACKVATAFGPFGVSVNVPVPNSQGGL